ncbi:MAG TPA: hypothetical protein VGE90_04535, partial [Chitinophaga sp.]
YACWFELLAVILAFNNGLKREKARCVTASLQNEFISYETWHCNTVSGYDLVPPPMLVCHVLIHCIANMGCFFKKCKFFLKAASEELQASRSTR